MDEKIVLNMPNTVDNFCFIGESKRQANKHEWLYHCTTSDVVLSILKNKEFWLSNLKLVNDKEEIERVDVSEFIYNYYVCCFTYDANISDEHWREYGSIDNGVAIGVKTNWFERKAYFISCRDRMDELIILRSREDSYKYRIKQQENGIKTAPFYIANFNFYQVIYENITKNIVEDIYLPTCDGNIYGKSYVSEIAGIVKSKRGICLGKDGEKYEKNWEDEKEVRLKVELGGGKDIIDKENSFIVISKIAVPLKQDAFRTIRLRFSPQFKEKDPFIQKIHELLPESEVEVI